MPQNRPRDNRAALLLTAPFLAVYGLLFIYPTLQLVTTSLTNAQLTAPGDFVGLEAVYPHCEQCCIVLIGPAGGFGGCEGAAGAAGSSH